MAEGTIASCSSLVSLLLKEARHHIVRNRGPESPLRWRTEASHQQQVSKPGSGSVSPQTATLDGKLTAASSGPEPEAAVSGLLCVS